MAMHDDIDVKLEGVARELAGSSLTLSELRELHAAATTAYSTEVLKKAIALRESGGVTEGSGRRTGRATLLT